MKRIIKRLLIFLGIFAFVVWGVFKLFFYVDSRQEKRLVAANLQQTRLTDAEMNLLEEGDIILRRGYGLFSDIIADMLNNKIFDVTHSGILYKKENEWYVIHSLSSDVSNIDGMQEQPLKTFLQYSVPKKVLVVRPNDLTPAQASEMVKRAQYYLNAKIPFDHIGVIDEPSELYCTELIYQILDNDLHYIAFPTDKKVRKDTFSTMTTLYNPQYFTIIINTYSPTTEP